MSKLFIALQMLKENSSSSQTRTREGVKQKNRASDIQKCLSSERVRQPPRLTLFPTTLPPRCGLPSPRISGLGHPDDVAFNTIMRQIAPLPNSSSSTRRIASPSARPSWLVGHSSNPKLPSVASGFFVSGLRTNKFGLPINKKSQHLLVLGLLEVAGGFEPSYKVLQTSA